MDRQRVTYMSPPTSAVVTEAHEKQLCFGWEVSEVSSHLREAYGLAIKVNLSTAAANS